MLDYVETGVSAVPEPATFGMMLGGPGLLAWGVRRQASR